MEGYNYVCDDPVLHIISRGKARELGMKQYFTGEPCSKGHISKRVVANHACSVCSNIASRKYISKNKELISENTRKWKEDNKEYVKWCKKQYQDRNKEKLILKRKQNYLENREEILKKAKQWREDNRDWFRERSRAYMRKRRETEPDFVAREKMRGILTKFLTRIGKHKSGRTHDTLKYSVDDFKNHIQNLFLEGMSWDNKGEWHIDHIYPVARFLDEGIDDPAIVSSLSNLAPMWAEHNMSKCDKLLQEWLDEKGEDSVEWRLYSRLL